MLDKMKCRQLLQRCAANRRMALRWRACLRGAFRKSAIDGASNSLMSAANGNQLRWVGGVRLAATAASSRRFVRIARNGASSSRIRSTISTFLPKDRLAKSWRPSFLRAKISSLVRSSMRFTAFIFRLRDREVQFSGRIPTIRGTGQNDEGGSSAHPDRQPLHQETRQFE